MTAPLLANPELVLCGLSMVPISFSDLVAAASGSGFDAISVGPAVYRQAVRDGLSMHDMRRVLDDSGMWVSEVEGVGNWLTPPEDKPQRWAQRVSDDELLDLAEALGARSVLVTHFGTPVPAEEAAGPFAALCDRAAGAGLAIALEFVAFATIMDLRGAWDVVEEAGRPNGGIMLDTWHYLRGRPDDELLRSIPADRIFGVQLADAEQPFTGPLEDDILRRRLPGAGHLGLASVVSELAVIGVRAPIGIEVWDKDLLAQGPQGTAQQLHRAMITFLGACYDPSAGS